MVRNRVSQYQVAIAFPVTQRNRVSTTISVSSPKFW
ncbi:hypothetical protein SPLC1_S533150 [Arthrospira platensis C1]|nr:hypothetical protein SPLC1_S533150 [Arthrospira platensis C1]